MLGRIAITSSFAGSLAALLLTVAQVFWITPLILQAEVYENNQAEQPVMPQAGEAAEFHEPFGSGVWEDGGKRILITAIGNCLLGTGYALVLFGCYLLRSPTGVGQGLMWGAAGYMVFFAAPSLGLPPELPGTAAADLASRQYWWLGSALATASGLWLLFLQQSWALRALGILLLVAPHLIGAPHPAMFLSLAPEELQGRFRLATLLGNAVFWLALGAISADCHRRWCIQ